MARTSRARPLVFSRKGVTTRLRSARLSRRPASPSPRMYYYFRSKEGLAQALLTVPLTELGRGPAADRDDREHDPSRALSR